MLSTKHREHTQSTPPLPPSPLRSSCTYARLVKVDHDSGILPLKLLELSRRALRTDSTVVATTSTARPWLSRRVKKTFR